MPGCQQQISGATYRVAKLKPGYRNFQWSHLTSRALNSLRIAGPNSDTEIWERTDSTWQLVDHSHETVGWIPELSDPYNLLVNILLRANWNHITLTQTDGESVISGSEDTFPTGSERGRFQLTIDNNTNIITDYQLNWNRSYDGCDGYLVTGTNGTYSDSFTFPTAVRTESEILSDCEITSLPENPRAHRVSASWNQECPDRTAAADYSQTYRFNTNTWSLLRIDFQAPDHAILGFTDFHLVKLRRSCRRKVGTIPTASKDTDAAPKTSSKPVRTPLHGSYIWSHQWLPPGQYEIRARYSRKSLSRAIHPNRRRSTYPRTSRVAPISKPWQHLTTEHVPY